MTTAFHPEPTRPLAPFASSLASGTMLSSSPASATTTSSSPSSTASRRKHNPLPVANKNVVSTPAAQDTPRLPHKDSSLSGTRAQVAEGVAVAASTALVSSLSSSTRSLTSMVSSGLQQPRHLITELLHAFDVTELATSARHSLSATGNIVFSPLALQAVKGDLSGGIANLAGLSGMAPHLMATHYLKRATANAQALALTGVRPATPVPADQLLQEDIPDPGARVSLFQGFKASHPVHHHSHSKGGKRGKHHHRRRRNGYGQVDEDDPNQIFTSLLSERERTIKEQVKLQNQKNVLQSELSQVAASIEALMAQQTNLG
ncbi:hypothetical protein BGW38_008156, partial [Lunasporangiospora selenospora]